MNRVQLSILALAIALPLLAYPIAFPPADPGTELVTRANDVGPVDESEFPGEILTAEDFSDDEWSFFERLVEEQRLERPVTESPDWFRALADGERDPGRFVVSYDDRYYHVAAYTSDPGPPLSAVAPRLLSFVLATILGAGAGYAYVTADG